MSNSKDVKGRAYAARSFHFFQQPYLIPSLSCLQDRARKCSLRPRGTYYPSLDPFSRSGPTTLRNASPFIALLSPILGDPVRSQVEAKRIVRISQILLTSVIATRYPFLPGYYCSTSNTSNVSRLPRDITLLTFLRRPQTLSESQPTSPLPLPNGESNLKVSNTVHHIPTLARSQSTINPLLKKYRPNPNHPNR